MAFGFFVLLVFTVVFVLSLVLELLGGRDGF